MKLHRILFPAALALLAGAIPASAQDATLLARLRSFEEVPAVSELGGGWFRAQVSEDETHIDWSLEIFNMSNPPTQAHIHFAQRGVNGGIMVFLCSNLGNGPEGTQECPTSPATISGTITAADVGGGAEIQGILPGQLGAVIRALKYGSTYVNVHTAAHAGGELRGQVAYTPAEDSGAAPGAAESEEP